MKYKLTCLYLLATLLVSQLSKAQSYNHSFQLKYGVFYYNDKESMGIKEPLDRPFSIGLQYQNNLTKALSNSIGVTAYSWNKGGTSYESYAIQDLLFLRNNVKVLNRLKPQIGIGFGVESSTLSSINDIKDNMFFYVPVNVGFQTDLTTHIALGIIGEFKYGFDTDFSKGRVVPNNTAGITLAYRFGRNAKKNVYNPIKWDPNEAELISVKNLKEYQASKEKRKEADERTGLEKLQRKEMPIVATSKGIKDIDSIAVASIANEDSVIVLGQSSLTSVNTVLKDSTTREALMLLTDTVNSNGFSNDSTLLVRNANLEDAKKLQKSGREIISRSELFDVDSNTTDTLYQARMAQSTLIDKENFNSISNTDTIYRLADQKVMSSQQLPVNTSNYLREARLPESGNSFVSNEGYSNQPSPLNTGPTSYRSQQVLSAARPLSSSYTGYEPARTQDIGYAESAYQEKPGTASQIQPNLNLGYTRSLNKTPETTSDATVLNTLIEQQRQQQVLLSGQVEMNKLLLTQLLSNRNQSMGENNVDSLHATIANLRGELNKTKAQKQARPVSSAPEMLSVITYGLNKVAITDEQRNIILSNVVKEYNRHAAAYIIVEAYTDSSGSPVYNKKLSDKRLSNIIDYLTTLGVPETRIVKNNYGETNSSDAINSEERRVVFKIKY